MVPSSSKSTSGKFFHHGISILCLRNGGQKGRPSREAMFLPSCGNPTKGGGKGVITLALPIVRHFYILCDCVCVCQRPARFSFLENSREFFFIFTSRSRSRAVSISLSLLEKEWRDFIFHFSLLEKSESYPYFTLFSREKRVKSGAGYNLTSIFVPNCISKNCQISSKHQPQNIGQISISKSWPNPVLQVWTKHQLKKSDKN